MIRKSHTKVRAHSSIISISDLNDLPNPVFRLGTALTVAEKVETGAVKSHTYHTYIEATGGYLIAILVFFTFFLNVGSSAFSTWWLAVWIKAGGGVSNTYPTFKIYTFCSICISLFD